MDDEDRAYKYRKSRYLAELREVYPVQISNPMDDA